MQGKVLFKNMSKIVYQLKVQLAGSEPPIWRQVHVLGDTRLSELHDIFQIVMGWDSEHDYQFVFDDDRLFSAGDLGTGDSRAGADTTTLGHLIKRAKTQFVYEYDFNDGWEHEVLVEKLRPVPDTDAALYPTCLAGERACPPEDSGGLLGYYELLESRAHPEQTPSAPPVTEDEDADWESDEEVASFADFDPERFDLEHVNYSLKVLFRRI